MAYDPGRPESALNPRTFKITAEGTGVMSEYKPGYFHCIMQEADGDGGAYPVAVIECVTGIMFAVQLPDFYFTDPVSVPPMADRPVFPNVVY